MNSIVADKRGGAFADDLYVVTRRTTATARSATRTTTSSSTSRRTAASTWIGPTRVNNDRRPTPANRDCGRNTNSIGGNSALCPAQGTGNDQFFPWITIDPKGNLNVTFHDRRLDTDSPIGSARGRPRRPRSGNYLVWYWGANLQDHPDHDGEPDDDGPGSVRCAPVRGARGGRQPDRRDRVQPRRRAGSRATGRTRRRCRSATSRSRTWGRTSTTRSGLESSRATTAATRAARSSAVLRTVAAKGTTATTTAVRPLRSGPTPATGAARAHRRRLQPGRNPICEQSDVFFDRYNLSTQGGDNGNHGGHADQSFLVAPCPTGIQDHGARRPARHNNPLSADDPSTREVTLRAAARRPLASLTRWRAGPRHDRFAFAESPREPVAVTSSKSLQGSSGSVTSNDASKSPSRVVRTVRTFRVHGVPDRDANRLARAEVLAADVNRVGAGDTERRSRRTPGSHRCRGGDDPGGQRCCAQPDHAPRVAPLSSGESSGFRWPPAAFRPGERGGPHRAGAGCCRLGKRVDPGSAASPWRPGETLLFPGSEARPPDQPWQQLDLYIGTAYDQSLRILIGS